MVIALLKKTMATNAFGNSTFSGTLCLGGVFVSLLDIRDVTSPLDSFDGR